ncbi:MAG: dihydrofolate reductase [Nocardioidaceae bacterium]
MTVALVVAVGTNGVIGRDGGLPWERTGDLAHFKALTTGHVLVMGRRTYESIGRPLPGRTTVVVTRQPDWPAPDGVIVCADVDAALDRAAGIDPEVFVVGGAQVYAAALPRADRLVVTHVEQAPDGDTYFPDVDRARWAETAREAYDGFSIATYDRL